MFAKIKHLAIVSQNYAMEAKFYQAIFGMKVAETQRPEAGAVVVGDGYVGLNINGRRPGRQAGFDHFGFEVEDVEVVFARLRDKYPTIEVLIPDSVACVFRILDLNAEMIQRCRPAGFPGVKVETDVPITEGIGPWL